MLYYISVFLHRSRQIYVVCARYRCCTGARWCTECGWSRESGIKRDWRAKWDNRRTQYDSKYSDLEALPHLLCWHALWARLRPHGDGRRGKRSHCWVVPVAFAWILVCWLRSRQFVCRHAASFDIQSIYDQEEYEKRARDALELISLRLWFSVWVELRRFRGACKAQIWYPSASSRSKICKTKEMHNAVY